jgi:Flp pilus assembly pilin Flp
MRIGERIKGRLRDSRGQAATEYMMLISVVTVAVVAASFTYVPAFKVAVFNLAEQVEVMLDGGTIGEAGYSRNDSTGGDFGEDGRGGKHHDQKKDSLPDGEL